jgi:hypothetical protein
MAFLQRIIGKIPSKSCHRKAFTTIPALCLLLLWLFRRNLFRPGPKTWKGGPIGRHLDNALRDYLFSQAEQRQRDAFRRILGFDLPTCPEKTANQVGALVLTQQWLAETLIRTKRRLEAQEQYATLYDTTTFGCSSGDFKPRVLRPNVGEWYRPWQPMLTEGGDRMIEPLFFDQNEMDTLLATEFQAIHSQMYPFLSQRDQVQLWGLCAVYWYGGIFFGPNIRSPHEVDNVNMTHSVLQEPCRNAQLWLNTTAPSVSIEYLSATPRHHSLKCVLEKLDVRLTEVPQDETLRNCPLLLSQVLYSLDQAIGNDECQLSYTRDLLEGAQVVTKPPQDPPRFQVDVSEVPGTDIASTYTKRKRSDILQQNDCSAGWFCDRCLRIPWLGSLDACRQICRTCYEKILCGKESSDRKVVVVNLTVKEVRGSSHRRIPRIIHQTWYEDLTAIRYPHLQRMQHSWKLSGWEYRFYTDQDARVYIHSNYPSRFVDAYDCIVPGAFKADLFRLLVLLKEGGVYADIDLQLDANLDQFITKDMSFFVPRDVPLDYWPDSNYCLWNGLLGASPGHPIVAKAVETLMNRILNRQDYYDIEAEMCQHSLTSQVWKLRVIPILLLTGPCALGIAVNGALGLTNQVQGIALGWLSTGVGSYTATPGHYWGDAMILLADRYDLGELRFTDIDRNILVASSNPDRFANGPVETVTEPHRISAIHYSKFDSDIVGESGVYKDDQTSDESVHIQVVHQYL